MIFWGHIRTGVVVREQPPHVHFYGQVALRLLGHHLRKRESSFKVCIFISRLLLTRRIGDDGVEERTTSPRISGDIKGAQVQDTLSNTVLTGGEHDTRLSVIFASHLSTVDVRTEYQRTKMGGRLFDPPLE
jgi:hypothetical protein